MARCDKALGVSTPCWGVGGGGGSGGDRWMSRLAGQTTACDTTAVHRKNKRLVYMSTRALGLDRTIPHMTA